MNDCKRTTIPIGSDFRVKIQITNLGENTHLSDNTVTLVCKFRVATAEIELAKSDLTQLDQDTYVAAIDSSELARGDLYLETHTGVPDSAFDDGVRNEIVLTYTLITIV